MLNTHLPTNNNESQATPIYLAYKAETT